MPWLLQVESAKNHLMIAKYFETSSINIYGNYGKEKYSNSLLS